MKIYMGTKIYRVLLLLVLAAIGFAHGCGKRTPDWPKTILDGIWIPDEAKVMEYNYFKKRTYEVVYYLSAPYPGGTYIDSMVAAMSQKGWKRLDYDFLNPKIKAHFARGNGGEWGYFSVSQENIVYQWMEDWEDLNRNIVVYRLRYNLKKGEDVRRKKELEVYVVYFPAAIRRQLESSLPASSR